MGFSEPSLLKNEIDGLQHMAFVKGELSSEEDTLVRVHSDCAISDIFGSLYCHSRAKLTESLKMIEANRFRGSCLYKPGVKQRGICEEDNALFGRKNRGGACAGS